jgi:DNA primase
MTKDELRAAMPNCTGWIDEIRRVFGNDAIARIDADEGGNVVLWKARKSMACADEENRAPQGSRNRRA